MVYRRYGGFWRRSIAFFIDQVILYFVSLILFLIGLLALGLRRDMMGRVLASPEEMTHGMGLFGFLYLAASVLAGMIYFTWFHGAGGRTPGKMLLGLRVIQASGDPMTPGIAFLRWVGYLISGPLFFLGFLWIAFDGRKQGWHDKIAATLVIRERGESNPAEREAAPTSFVHAGMPQGMNDQGDPTEERTTPLSMAAGMQPSREEQKDVVSPPEPPQEKPDSQGTPPLP